MTDAIKRWPWPAIIQIISLIFLAGVAMATLAPKPWVIEQIQVHEKQSQEQYQRDMKDIKESLNRIETRQWEQAQKGK